MSTSEDRSSKASGTTNADTRLEVIVIPVSDVDRAKEFYSRLGWRLDADRAVGDNFRLIQFTPPRAPAARSSSARTSPRPNPVPRRPCC